MAVAPDQPTNPAPALALVGVHQLSAPTGLRLSGQADVRAVDLLRRAIAALPPDEGEMHLQLAGLEYIDVAVTRELVRLAAARPACPGRTWSCTTPRWPCSG